MGWPFTSAPAPSFETDASLIAVPTSLAAVPNLLTSQKAWLLGIWVINDTDDAIDLQLVDGDDVPVLPSNAPMTIPGRDRLGPLNPAFLPVTGLKWAASDVGLLGKIWGYK